MTDSPSSLNQFGCGVSWSALERAQRPRTMPVRVAAALLIDGDRFLLGHRHPQRANYPDVWDFPGGHIDEGETPSEAVTRELLEELAIDVSDTVPEAWATIDVDEVEVIIFLIEAWRGTVRNSEPAEHDALAWFRVEDVETLTFASPEYADLLRRAMTEHADRVRSEADGQR